MKTTSSKISSLVIALFVMLSFSACHKKDNPTPTPATKTQWVTVYRDVLLGDQNNNTIGHFLKTQTGQVLTIDDAYSQQAYMSMMYFTEYGNNYRFLTFPGNAYNEGIIRNDEDNNFFTRANVGLNFWDAASTNSGEMKYAATLDEDMTLAEFNALAQSLSWTDFDAKFKAYNSGDANLSFTRKSITPSNGDVYMIQLNNTVRAFVYIKNVIEGGTSGGSVKLDMVIEGTDSYTNDSQASKVQPSKH